MLQIIVCLTRGRTTFFAVCSVSVAVIAVLTTSLKVPKLLAFVRRRQENISVLPIRCNIPSRQVEQSVPYIELSSKESRDKNKVIIYFHGNSQNIVDALGLAEPIFNSTQITTLLIEYPTYGSYVAKKTYDIAKQIMSNSLEFYKRVCAIYKVQAEDIYIIGRSIGSGPACHLAAAINNKKLVLISPFDSVSAVAKEKFGGNMGKCISFFMHDHFNNVEQMKKYNGELMVIHGKNDEVISIQNATNLVKQYEGKSRKCQFIQPPLMTHNYFKTPQITDPIKAFFNSY